MDLLQTVRKEGSRGGVNFSWDDVKNSQHRENYLGHSVMAPVGRWQQNKDLGWYAKAEDAELTEEERHAKEQERKRDELRKVKEAEEDAMAKAMGLPVPNRSNANNEPLGMSREKQQEVNKALKEALDDDPDQHREKRKRSDRRDGSRERSSRSHRSKYEEPRESRRGSGRDERPERRHRRSRSRSREHHRHLHDRLRSRSPSRERKHRSRSRDRRHNGDRDSRYDHREAPRPRSRERHRKHHHTRSRSRSPYGQRRNA